MRKGMLLLLLAGALLFSGMLSAVGPVSAQSEDGAVHAIMFSLPTCGHCNYVKQNVFPPLQEQHGDLLRIHEVNLSGGTYNGLLSEVCMAYGVPTSDCGAVPLLVVGDQWMLGSADIPARFPGLIEQGLAAGGTPLPDLPSIDLVADAGGVSSNPVWWTAFEADPIGNGLAVFVLLLLIGSMGALLLTGYRGLSNAAALDWLTARGGWALTVGSALLAALVALTLVLNGEDLLSLPTLAALTVSALMLLVSVGLYLHQPEDSAYRFPAWVTPVVIVGGLAVAGYMAYVETLEVAPVCGQVGDCTTVQTSTYAYLFGVLPVGVFGLLGYAALLGAWLARFASERLALLGRAAFLVFALFGLAFSIYLTFLEPFVIGASCAWCLTSALVMLTLSFLGAKEGWEAIRVLALGPDAVKAAKAGASSKRKRRSAAKRA